MANSRVSDKVKEYAIVDTLPDSDGDGYFTNVVSLRKLAKDLKVEKMFFSIRNYSANESVDNAVATVVLQFMCAGDERWQDYYNDGNAFSVGDRIQIEDLGDVVWRAGIKEDGYTSGAVIFGFDW